MDTTGTSKKVKTKVKVTSCEYYSNLKRKRTGKKIFVVEKTNN